MAGRISNRLKTISIPDEDLLSDAEIEALRVEAKKKVLEDRKKAAQQKVLAAMLREENERIDPSDEIVLYTIDIPGYAKSVRLDGIEYFHGQTYKFTTRKLSSILEVVQGAWRHERSIGEANRNNYVAPSNKAGPAKYTLSAGFINA